MRNSLVVIALLLAPSLPASAQEQTPKRDEDVKTAAAKALLKENPPRERAAGVLIKVEKLDQDRAVDPADSATSSKAKTEAGKARPTRLRLTINTNAEWSDWVRDQTKVKDTGPPRKDAEAGARSVATTGQPADANSKVVVEIIADSKVETRFRTPEDSTSRGYKTPEEARSGSSADTKATTTKSQSAKPVQFTRDDLKPGLFVEADFHLIQGKNPISVVTVIRPISATKATPKK